MAPNSGLVAHCVEACIIIWKLLSAKVKNQSLLEHSLSSCIARQLICNLTKNLVFRMDVWDIGKNLNGTKSPGVNALKEREFGTEPKAGLQDTAMGVHLIGNKYYCIKLLDTYFLWLLAQEHKDLEQKSLSLENHSTTPKYTESKCRYRCRDSCSLSKSTYTLEGIWLKPCMKFATWCLFISVLNVRVTMFYLTGKYGSYHAAWIVTLLLVLHFHLRRPFAKAGSEHWREGDDDLLSSLRCDRSTW